MNKIGLTLSGGGIRGMAHLGVLEYLLEIDIKPSVISGTSAGSLVGIFYAAGYTPKEILEIGKAEKFFGYSNIKLRWSGLFSADIFDNILTKYIKQSTIEELSIPIYIVATDLTNARQYVFDKGSIANAVKASCCVPLVFEPVKYGDIFLCDGGILNNFPVDIIKNRCDTLIGINVSNIEELSIKSWSYRKVLERTIKISIDSNTYNQKDLCNIYVEPPSMSNYGTFDYSKSDQLFQLGYNYAKSIKDNFNKIGIKKV
ncbi:MAG: patatin-like phospholipase family protein [Flavobacteriaceae bacterium]|nr:patatin-like phospholipase family protein [Flavobacteriaceae bacterium]